MVGTLIEIPVEQVNKIPSNRIHELMTYNPPSSPDISINDPILIELTYSNGDRANRCPFPTDGFP